MHHHLPQKQLEALFDQVVQEVTEPATGLRLFPTQSSLSGQLCTVHIAFRQGFHSILSFCADTAMFIRMAQNALQTEEITPQDLEDFAKEYLNVLCGQLSAHLFRTTRVASRFTVPDFCVGQYQPEGHQAQFALHYISGRRERAQLTHHIPENDSL